MKKGRGPRSPDLLRRESNDSGNNSDSYLFQVLFGVILSDGSLVKKYETGGTYLKFAQSIINTGYMMFIFNIFAERGLCNMITPSVCTTRVKGKTYQYLQFSTKSYKV
jgi:hypothetical protein